MLRWLFRRIRDNGWRGYVSLATRRAHQYHAETRGVDLPHWMTPEELAAVHRAEDAVARRAALRVVGGTRR
jgi:hypothetical protein